MYSGNSRKAPGGWGFFFDFSMRLAKKKAPPQIYIISIKEILIENHNFQKSGAFFFRFSNEASPKKAPPPWGFSRVSPVPSIHIPYSISNYSLLIPTYSPKGGSLKNSTRNPFGFEYLSFTFCYLDFILTPYDLCHLLWWVGGGWVVRRIFPPIYLIFIFF